MRDDSFDWRAHIGTAAAAVAAVLVACRLLAVAHYDLATAYGILAAQGTGSVAVGTLLAVLWLVPIGTLLMGLLLFTRALLVGSSFAGAVPWVLIGALTTVYFVPWDGFTIATGLAALVLVVASLVARRRLGKVPLHESLPARTDGAIRVFVWGIVLMSGLTAASAAEPWMPAESLVLRGGGDLTGFVLSDKDDELVILTAEERTLMRLPVKEVRSRQYCEREPDPYDFFVTSTGPAQPSLLGLLFFGDDARYPPC